MKHKKLLTAGLAIFLISYTPLLIPQQEWSLSFLTSMAFLFMLGVILISESITLNLTKKSLISSIFKDMPSLTGFVLVSAIGGFFLDGIAKWLGKLWFYPYWDFGFYLLVFIPGFAVYWLMIAESYLAAKYFWDWVIKSRHIPTKPYRWETLFFSTLGSIGVVFLIFFTHSVMSEITGLDNILFTDEISKQVSSYSIGFYKVIALFVGIWFLFEYLEHKLHKNTVIKDTIHFYFSPILAVITSALLLAVIMEVQNLPLQFWVYKNFPFENITILDIPVMIFATWPLQYIAFLSLFRTLTGEQSREIWRGDLIE